MLLDITVKPLKRNSDERGSFMELVRQDWKDLLEEDDLVQVNYAMTYPNIIRAWHKHTKGQTDYFVVLKGALKICAYDEKTRELDEIVSTDQEPQIVKVPGYYWHGYKVLGNEPAFLVYFVTDLYDHKNPDELRRPWDDATIVPNSINGKKDDPRAGKPWNWLAAPHK